MIVLTALEGRSVWPSLGPPHSRAVFIKRRLCVLWWRLGGIPSPPCEHQPTGCLFQCGGPCRSLLRSTSGCAAWGLPVGAWVLVFGFVLSCIAPLLSPWAGACFRILKTRLCYCCANIASLHLAFLPKYKKQLPTRA